MSIGEKPAIPVRGYWVIHGSDEPHDVGYAVGAEILPDASILLRWETPVEAGSWELDAFIVEWGRQRWRSAFVPPAKVYPGTTITVQRIAVEKREEQT